MTDQTDSQLLASFAETKSETAFAELVHRHVDFVYSTALRMVRDSHLAEDVSQAVFVALAKNAISLADHPVLTGWLHRTTRNIAAQAVRTEARRRVREQEAAVMNELLSAQPDNLWNQIEPHLDDALSELTESDRDVIFLRYIQQQSARKMADALGISDEAAQKRVNRAVDRLREIFLKRGVTVASASLVTAIAANSVHAAPTGLALMISSATTLAGSTAASSATVLGAKTIAMTTLQKTILGVAIATVIGTGIYEGHQATVRRNTLATLQKQHADLTALIEQLQRERDAATGRVAALSAVPKLPAPQFQPAIVPPDDLQSTNLYERLKNKSGKLNTDQVASYLKDSNRNAASLLAAYRTTGDPTLLAEAMEKFPNDPQVAFEALFKTNSAPEDFRKWAEAFKNSAPDNALGNYLSALDYFRSGQTDRAIEEMLAATGKSLRDYSSERYQDDTEAYLSAGYSVADAKGTAGFQLLLPQLKGMKELGLNLVELGKTYQQSGDSASAEATFQMVMNLGQQYSTPAPGQPEISRLVGMVLEQIALRAMDPNSPYGTSGQTVQDRYNEIAAQRTQLEQRSSQVEAILPTLSDEDWVTYRDRWMMFGEENAEQWLLNTHSTATGGAGSVIGNR